MEPHEGLNALTSGEPSLDHPLPAENRQEFLKLTVELPEVKYFGPDIDQDKIALSIAQITTSLKLALEVAPSLGDAFKRPIQPMIMTTYDVKTAADIITKNHFGMNLPDDVDALTLSHMEGNNRRDFVLIGLNIINPAATADSPEILTIDAVVHECYHLNQQWGLTTKEKELDATEKTIAFFKKLADMHPELSKECEHAIQKEKNYQKRFL